MSRRREFTRAFKVAAVKKANRQRVSAAQTARELEIDPNLLDKWRRAWREQGAEAFPGSGGQRGLAAENRRLTAENQRLRVEREIWQRSAGAGQSAGEKFTFIEAHRSEWPVGAQCAALGVSRGGYARWRTRPPSAAARRREELTARICKVFRASSRRYGAPRVHAELAAQGVKCDKKTVAKLMRAGGLAARRAKAYRLCTTNSNHAGPIARNLLVRDYFPAAPNVRWASDITYVPTQEGWLYLAVVEDLYSRKIVGWATSVRLVGTLAVRALKKAVRNRLGDTPTRCRRRDGRQRRLLVHSDRGVEYASDEYRDFLARHNLLASMSRRGNCWDNAPVESLFATLTQDWNIFRQTSSRGGSAQAFTFLDMLGSLRKMRQENPIVSKMPCRGPDCLADSDGNGKGLQVRQCLRPPRPNCRPTNLAVHRLLC